MPRVCKLSGICKELNVYVVIGGVVVVVVAVSVTAAANVVFVD
jgi:hypothetical protein